jgi:hypothetical protein
MSNIKELTTALLFWKNKENEVKNERIRIEVEIAELIPGPERGSKTITLDNGIKVTVERGFNYKAEIDKIQNFFDGQLDGGKQLIPPIKTKTTRELDEKGYEWYRSEKPNIFSGISQYVKVTPKKIAVSINVK